ncbi:MAG: DUF523 domain-containing protein [Candidatus Izemoplasmatales bacterium]|nr:DUF523 domain-containing protein [bacterium]MDZ4197048.1 DUF523 domain-containing protein [Candidatus Izemoplasmatales bacterium]
MENIAVSACLLGYHCKYDGGSNLNHDVINFCKGKQIIPICPEVFGGLDTPRIPSEIQQDGRVLNKFGRDVSFCFQRGTKLTWEVLKKHHCTQAILKDGSPSCGFKTIYDGTFTNVVVEGLGVTARFLKDKGVTFIDF